MRQVFTKSQICVTKEMALVITWMMLKTVFVDNFPSFNGDSQYVSEPSSNRKVFFMHLIMRP